MAGNASFDAIASTTIKNYRKTLEDNIFSDMPLLFWLRTKGMERKQRGGETIVVPLLFAANSTAKSYDGYDTLDISPQEGITAAEFQWRQASVSITISGKEERQNDGKEKIVSLLKSKIMQAEESLKDALSGFFFADGTGNNNKDMLGLQAIVADDPTSGTLAGIDRSSSANAFWRNYQASATKTSTAFDNLLAAMVLAYNTTSKGRNHPDFILADITVFGGYEGLLVAQKRFQGVDQKMADAGFETLKFKGATMTFDVQMNSSGRLYLLNSKHLEWVVHPDANFTPSQFVKPDNQDAKTSQVLIQGNLTANNCSRHGVLTAIT